MCQELFPEEVQPEEVLLWILFSNIFDPQSVLTFLRLQGQFFFNEEEVTRRRPHRTPPTFPLFCNHTCCFSLLQVASGAQADGLGRWDAALEVLWLSCVLY
jgi:hypothetical protein